MSKKTRMVIALFLLVAFGGWIVITVLPKDSGRNREKRTEGAGRVYEPKFRDEGDLAFLSEEGDTLKVIDIEVAENPEEIQYGMMYRRSMDENTGMLFLMGEERMQSFWMKNTYVPLDIIFINEDHTIVSIQKNAEPLTEDSRPSEAPASMVLEVYGGFSDKFNIRKGTQIRYARE